MEDNMNAAENILKDVACVVFYPCHQRDNCSIYLIDISRKELRGFVHLNETDYPIHMAFVLYKSMLYMFGGSMDSSGMAGCPYAYVLDLFELANSGSSNRANYKVQKPSPLTQMHWGKCDPVALVVGHKICVFDKTLGHKPINTHFEVFDPERKTWKNLPDPFCFSPAYHFVEEYHVIDDKLLVRITNALDSYMFDFCASANQEWQIVGHRQYSMLERSFNPPNVVKIGSFVFESLNTAYDHDAAVRDRIDVKWLGDDKTADKNYEVYNVICQAHFAVDNDKICTIAPMLLRKPDPIPMPPSRKWDFLVSKRRPLVRLKPFVSRYRSRYRKERKGAYRFVVNVYRVDCSTQPLHLNLLDSFTVRMPGYKHGKEAGEYDLVSLCDS